MYKQTSKAVFKQYNRIPFLLHRAHISVYDLGLSISKLTALVVAC